MKVNNCLGFHFTQVKRSHCGVYRFQNAANQKIKFHTVKYSFLARSLKTCMRCKQAKEQFFFSFQCHFLLYFFKFRGKEFFPTVVDFPSFPKEDDLPCYVSSVLHWLLNNTALSIQDSSTASAYRKRIYTRMFAISYVHPRQKRLHKIMFFTNY